MAKYPGTGQGFLGSFAAGGLPPAASVPMQTAFLENGASAGSTLGQLIFSDGKTWLGLGGGPSVPAPLISVTCGNAISQNGFYTLATGGVVTDGFASKSEFAHANSFHPIGYWPKVITPVGSTIDAAGNYGSPGATLSAIIIDMQATWFPALVAGAIIPGLVSGVDLVTADILGSDDAPTIVLRVRSWIALVQSKFPGVIVHLNSPHPNSGLTSALQSKFLAVRAGMLSLDDGISVFVTDLCQQGGVANPQNITQVLPQYTTDGLLLPNGLGASVNGRLMAGEFRRISRRIPPYPKPSRQVNPLLFQGLEVYAVAGFTGTVPVSANGPSLVQGAVTPGSGTLVAGNPGIFTMTWTPRSLAETIIVQGGATTGLPATSAMLNSRLKIVSGASSIRALVATLQNTGTPATADRAPLPNPIGDAYSYKDGDVIHFITPQAPKPATTFTGLYGNFVLYPAVINPTVPIVIEFQQDNYVDLS